MTQRQAKYITTRAFPEPNYTQTPNDFFEMLPSMEHSEIAVTLVMTRNTFGFHRTSFKMGLGKLADAAGISRNSAKTGAESAEARGTFRRVNPDAQTEAEWELIVGQPLTPFNDCIGDGQPLHTPLSTIDSQSPIKESIKEKKDMLDMLLEQEQKSQPIRNACLDFENALLGSTVSQWPWDSNSKWQKFAKWVAAQDPAQFKQYADWRKKDGKYHAMSNNKIRQDPQIFIDTGWPTFLAHVSMYRSNQEEEFGL